MKKPRCNNSGAFFYLQKKRDAKLASLCLGQPVGESNPCYQDENLAS